MNPNIILSGQPVNVLGAMQQGTQMAAETNQVRQQNALRQFMGQNGAAVMQGDPAALGQYASLAGPEAALGVQGARLGMDATRQGMARTDQVMRYADTAEGRAVAEYAARLSGAEREAEVARMEQKLMRAASVFDPNNLGPINQVFVEEGLPPVETAQQALLMLGRAKEVRDAFKFQQEMTAGPETFRMASPEEAAQYGAQAGQFGPDGKFYPINPPRGMSLTVGADGTVRMTEGNVSEGAVNPSAPETMLATIDGILNDPALETSTGVLSMLQAVPGTPQYRFGTRVRQLQGQAFLQAFESLKGGGQITEIEGTKATEAIGRLDSAQSASDYRAALTELRDIITKAQTRPPGWANTPAAQEAPQGEAPQPGVTEDGYRFLGGDPSNPENWEKVE